MPIAIDWDAIVGVGAGDKVPGNALIDAHITHPNATEAIVPISDIQRSLDEEIMEIAFAEAFAGVKEEIALLDKVKTEDDVIYGPLDSKTIGKVWYELNEDKFMEFPLAEMTTIGEPGAAVQQVRVEKLDIRELTLEEFLLRAGVVREEAAVVVPARREIKESLHELTLEDFLRRAGVAREEDARVRRDPEAMEGDRMGRSKKRPANLSTKKGRRIIQNGKPVARSRELKQSTAVTMRLNKDNQQQLNLREEENGRAKQNVNATSSFRNGFSQNILVRPDSPSKQLMTEVDDINIANVDCRGSDCIQVPRKQSKVWTLDREYGISRDVLEQHSKRKLGDVAEILGVSRSTLKRICRKHHIFRWPPRRAKNPKRALAVQESFRTTQENVKESTQRNKSLCSPPQEKYSVSNAQTRITTAEVLDDSSIMVKAIYKDDIIKFQLLVSSRKLDLEKEVATRLRLSVESFKIKYLDEDDDWVLITCDTDLRTCISTLRSQGKTTLKILVGCS